MSDAWGAGAAQLASALSPTTFGPGRVRAMFAAPQLLALAAGLLMADNSSESEGIPIDPPRSEVPVYVIESPKTPPAVEPAPAQATVAPTPGAAQPATAAPASAAA